MAKKAKTAKKSAKTASSNAKSSTRSTANSAYDFAELSKQFASPSQFWNLSSLPTFQPSNVQQVIEQIMETSQKNLETMTACTQMAVERAKELIEEQTDFTQRFFNDTASTFQEALSNNNGDPREKMEEISGYAKEYLEQAASHARKAAEENIEVAQQISNKISKRISDCVEEIRSAA